MARWIKQIMADAGIDTLVFKQHSTRSASAAWYRSETKAFTVAQICKQAQWSVLATTYWKLYHKVVLQTGY